MKRVFNLLVVDGSDGMCVIHAKAFEGINDTLETIRTMQETYKNLQQRVTLTIFHGNKLEFLYDNVTADKARPLYLSQFHTVGDTARRTPQESNWCATGGPHG